MSVVAGSCLPGEEIPTKPLTPHELRRKALYEILLVAADAAEEVGEERVAECLRNMAGNPSMTLRLEHFKLVAQQMSWKQTERSAVRGALHPDVVMGARYVKLEEVWQLLTNHALGLPPRGGIALSPQEDPE